MGALLFGSTRSLSASATVNADMVAVSYRDNDILAVLGFCFFTPYSFSIRLIAITIEFVATVTRYVRISDVGPGGGLNSVHMDLDGEGISVAQAIDMPKCQLRLYRRGEHHRDKRCCGAYA